MITFYFLKNFWQQKLNQQNIWSDHTFEQTSAIYFDACFKSVVILICFPQSVRLYYRPRTNEANPGSSLQRWTRECSYYYGLWNTGSFWNYTYITWTFFCVCRLWQYGLWSFQTGGTKLERFLPKNQHTQRKLLNFENWVNGEVSKSAKSPNLLTFKVNFLCQKLSESFSIFFSSKNTNFMLLIFFDNINF